jgi:hypothetical protein
MALYKNIYKNDYYARPVKSHTNIPAEQFLKGH